MILTQSRKGAKEKMAVSESKALADSAELQMKKKITSRLAKKIPANRDHGVAVYFSNDPTLNHTDGLQA